MALDLELTLKVIKVVNKNLIKMKVRDTGYNDLSPLVVIPS